MSDKDISDLSTHQKDKKKRWLIVEYFLVISLVCYTIFRSWILWILPKKYKDISEDIVLITGGGKGLGRMLAVEFAKHNPRHVSIYMVSSSCCCYSSSPSCSYFCCCSSYSSCCFSSSSFSFCFSSTTSSCLSSSNSNSSP